ncbi:hypothetical protein NDU88_001258 [Pleurodeles waltl]|uniref:Uncharacterized protein n=1 Tax=Pleurodeles waltl TaxID=8319 RepID=A0AAV7V7X9_PLEWA|nr:hypothetical protein NDU88_001258 [Pleurodeles waltl]
MCCYKCRKVQQTVKFTRAFEYEIPVVMRPRKASAHIMQAFRAICPLPKGEQETDATGTRVRIDKVRAAASSEGEGPCEM